MGRPVMQFQILSREPERASRFYTEIFGWRVDAHNALGYRRIETDAGRGIDGGIWPAPPGAPSFVQLFIEVDDVAGYCERVTGQGGSILIPPQRLPDGDELAIVQDPDGISFGLYRKG